VSLLPLADLANAIPRSSYLFGVSWPDVRRTLLVAVEQDSDPYAVMIPTAEIIRFYYAPSTRLAQALFWGEYSEMFNAERSGIFEEGVVRVHLRRWLEDQDAWTLARYLSSPVMQREAARLYQSLQLDQLNCTSLIAEPDHALKCGFPFEGPTTIQGIAVRFCQGRRRTSCSVAPARRDAILDQIIPKVPISSPCSCQDCNTTSFLDQLMGIE
jgi:hypothetical protein